MSTRVPDLDSVVGVLDDLAPQPDVKTENGHAKNITSDLDLEFGERPAPAAPGQDGLLPTRQRQVQELIKQNRFLAADVPVAYGSRNAVTHERVRVARIGEGLWVEGSTYAIRAMVMARNPRLQMGIQPEPVDVTTQVVEYGQASPYAGLARRMA